MPSWLPEGDKPSPGDTEVRSLWKINSLFQKWAVAKGKTPTLNYLGGVAPSPHDTEVLSLQKINACAISLTT